jgi:hypothetical protein
MRKSLNVVVVIDPLRGKMFPPLSVLLNVTLPPQVRQFVLALNEQKVVAFKLRLTKLVPFMT